MFAENRKRLLICTSTFPVFPGDGRARFVVDLAQALSNHFEVTVLAPHAPGALLEDNVDGVAVHRFRYFWPSSSQRLVYGPGIPSNMASSWLARIQIPFFIVAQTFAIYRRIRMFRPDVVNCHWIIPQGFSATITRVFHRIPIALHVHAADVYLLRRIPFGSLIARFVAKRCEVLFAAGSHVRDVLDELLGSASGAILRPMGVWSAAFIPPDISKASGQEGLRRIIFVGRLVEKKGLVYLIRALGLVKERLPETELVVIGTGPLEPSLRREVEQLGLEGDVKFLGVLPHDQIVSHLHNSDVACVPSVVDSKGETEGMPTVVLEALASGIKVVGSDVNGIPDVLKDRRNGWLARPGDPKDLARAVLEALTDERAEKIAAAGRATAEDHDWALVGAMYGDALRDLTQ